MKGHPNSYLDPAYDRLEAAVSAKLGLPDGLLGAVRTKGERSNADEVSSKGARGVYQFTTEARNLVRKKYGIDAFLSAENMAEAAGLLLKEGLDRNGGDPRAAVREYVGGTDTRNHGPVTRAYVDRVLGGSGGSAFDRAKAKQIGDDAPSIAKVYEAYKSGKMSAEDRQAFESDVNSGAVLLPRGAKIEVAAKPVAVLPAGAVQAYNNHSEMSDGERAQIDQDLKAGLISLPHGARLTRPAARTGGEMFAMGAADIPKGVASLADLPGNFVSGVTNLLNMPGDAAIKAMGGRVPEQMGANPIRNMTDMALNAAGAPIPATNAEQLVSAVNQGAVQGLATAGLAAPLAASPGVTGAVGRALSSSPIVDTVSGAVSGAASEGARQSGAGPIGQLAAGLAGGLVPAGAAGVAERVSTKFGPKVAKVVETTPREVLIDETGQLTDEGREIVARAGVEPDQVKAAYDDAATPQAEPGGQTVRVFEGAEHPVEVVGAAERNAADGRDYVPVRTPDGQEGYVPADEVVTKPAAESGPAQTPETAAAPASEAPLPASAAARMAEAKAVGVDLTQGQATKDYELQAAENDLAGTLTADGKRVREHFATQTDQIKEAAANFQAAIGDTTLNGADRGTILKDSLRTLASQGEEGVKRAYTQVRDLAEELGDNAKGLIALDSAPIREKVLDILGDDTVPDAIRTGLTQIAAKYGIIGEAPRHIPETGRTTVMVRDHENNLVKGPNFAGQVTPLDLSNAWEFHQRLNTLYDKMANRNPQEAIKPILDEAIATAAERAVSHGHDDIGKAAKAARETFKAHKATFAAKDAIESLIAWKKGTQTDAVLPEKVWSIVFGQGPDALTNIKKVRTILLNNPGEVGHQAWAAIQAQTAADLFHKALVVNGAGGEGAISGAKLRSAREKFGTKKLQLILGDERFNSYMRLERVIADATISLPGTKNPSGSGHLLARFFGSTAKGALAGASGLPVVGKVVDVVAGLAKQGAERAQAERVAEGAVNFTPAKAAEADAAASPKVEPGVDTPEPADAIRQFLELGASNRLLAPLLASSAASQKDRDQ